MVRNLSWPAVSQICSFTRLPSSSMVRILKSMPIVVMKLGVNESSLKRSRQHDLPTHESPMSSSLICFRTLSDGPFLHEATRAHGTPLEAGGEGKRETQEGSVFGASVCLPENQNFCCPTWWKGVHGSGCDWSWEEGRR